MRIETDRLIITEFTLDMVNDVHKNSLDEDVRKFVPDEVFETVEEAKETVEFLMSQYDSDEGPLVYPIITKDGEKNIGYVQLPLIAKGVREVGYHIAKQYTGNGYATEAVKTFLPVMAEKLGITEVYVICLKENKASKRVLDKCGFEALYMGIGEHQGEQREIYKSVWRA